MKKVILILFVGVLGTIIGYQSKKTPVVTDDLMLENVEALANEENKLPIYCEASGCCICPINGARVKYIIESYGLRK